MTHQAIEQKATYYYCREASTGEGASTSSFSFEEEVASLLLDMRDKIVDVPRKEEGRKSDGITARVSCGLDAFAEDSSVTRKRKASFDSEDSFDEINEIEETDEPEWKHDELYDEDDDEWLDSKTVVNAGPNSVGSGIKIPRKKAPSGSACEKHKRWKKRCPEDCPMRKQKSKKRSENSEDYDTTPSPPTNRRSMNKQQSLIEADCVTLFRLSLYQIRNDLSGDGLIKPDGFAKHCAPRDGMVDEMKPLFSAEQPLASPQPKLERMSTRGNSQFSSGDDLSPAEEEDSFDMKDEYPSSPEMKSPRGSPKSLKRMRTAKSRSGRKYLPQACDRHKLLHAKCPASCPDRLRRDAELIKHSSSSEDIASSALIQ